MGDGRYYTYNQFFSVIILTFLIIFIVISAMSSYYRNTNNKGSRYITAIFTQVAMVVVLRFIENVIVSMQVAKILRYSQNVFLMMGTITFTYYLKMCVMPIYQQTQNQQNHHAFWSCVVGIFGLTLFIWGAFSRWSLIIQEYTFHNIVYTKMYSFMHSMIVFVLMVNTYKIYQLKKTVQGAYKSRLLACVIFVMLIMPLLIYIIAVATKSVFVDYLEFLILFTFSFVVDFLTVSFIPYAVTPIAFDKIKDMINDYIFVTDVNDYIVYKNENINQQLCFSSVSKVNKAFIKELFIGEVRQKKNKHGEPYLKVVNNQKASYFSYRVADLINQNKIMGQIIIVSDITDLVELVNYLEEKKLKAEVAHHKLIDYSEVVYYLEKEKEINVLLEKITNEQETSMYEIISEIDDLIEKVQDEDFEMTVNRIIHLIERNLSQVREAVTTYREYYEG